MNKVIYRPFERNEVMIYSFISILIIFSCSSSVIGGDLCHFRVKNAASMHFDVEVDFACHGMDEIEIEVTKRSSWYIDIDEFYDISGVKSMDTEDLSVKVVYQCAADNQGRTHIALPLHKRYEPATHGGIPDYTYWPVSTRVRRLHAWRLPLLGRGQRCAPDSAEAALVMAFPVGNLDHLPYVFALNILLYTGSLAYIGYNVMV